jgi:hypothetical protein
MAFLVNCNAKKCGKYVEPALDTVSNKVICPECDGEITNLTEITKKTMKNMGQIKRNDKKGAFSTFCNACKKDTSPIMGDKDKIICNACKTELKSLTTPFQQLVRDYYRVRKNS